MVALLATIDASAAAQSPSAGDDSPARLIPAQDLSIYGEFDGLDAHAAGWRQTAAYKILNETTTGAMLEDLFVQIFPRTPFRELTGPEALLVAKHVMKAGFVIAENTWNQDGAKRHINTVILRNAFGNREIRPIFARLLQNMPAAGTKSQSVVRSGHRLITGKARDGDTFYWLVEETKKADLIILTGQPDSVDRVLDTIDGKTPSILGSPVRAELMKTREGFDRTGFFMLDPEPVRRADPADAMAREFERLNIGRFDFAGGFRDDALMTTSRLHSAKGGSKGEKPALLAAFDKATIPPIPAGVPGFMTLGLNLKAIPAWINAAPTLRDAYAGLIADIKGKTKIKIEEDIFAQLGPKITTYLTPAKGGGPAGGVSNLAGLMGGLGRPGADFLPKFAILIDVVNPTAFGKTLDELMSYANRQLKATFLTPPGPGNEPPPPPPPGGSRRGGGPGGPPVPEFRLMLGETKSYVFTVPPELSSRFPATFRPTFRLGPKQLAIGPSAEVARAALEAKGAYTPPSEITAAFGQVPGKLDWLLIVDPRESTPEILASLPGKLQTGSNAANPAALAAAAARPPGGAPDAKAPAPTPAGPLVLQVDPAKLPAAAEIRRLLYPAIYTLDEDGDAIRFTSRAAFPPVPDPAFIGLIIGAGRARLVPNGAPPGVATPGTPPAPRRPANRCPPRRRQGRPTRIGRSSSDAPAAGPRRDGRVGTCRHGAARGSANPRFGPAPRGPRASPRSPATPARSGGPASPWGRSSGWSARSGSSSPTATSGGRGWTTGRTSTGRWSTTSTR